MDPVEVGLACGSDTAHLSLLGYDPRVYYRGRGAFESWGLDWPCHLSNFATLDEKTGIVTSRRADRHFEEEGPILCAALDGMKLPSFPQYEVRVRTSLSGNISGTDPLKDNRLLLKAEALDDSHEAKTAAVVNELSKEITKILVSHPVNAKRIAEGKNVANVVLLRRLRHCRETWFMAMHGSSNKIIAGLGLSLGIDILEAPGATGDYRTLLTSKASAIAKALSAPLQSCPQAIDDAGHDKASILKLKALEAVDTAVGQLARLLWEAESSGKFQFFLCVTGDHSTPVEYGDHSFEPVPFTICQLKDFVGAIGESNICRISLDPFPIPSVKSGEDLTDDLETEERRDKSVQSYSGDSVFELNEIAAARDVWGVSLEER
ncbi:Metalloenzyme [Sesbania bispinosa]|nr:Metalloenzyme [Sesbania bispinosa]